jgi:iduronate 2-sulfatase
MRAIPNQRHWPFLSLFARIAGLLSGLLCMAPSLGLGATRGTAEPLNVLFIAIDDMRPILGAYGDRVVKSPNMDRLAAEGLLFNRAYCMVAICHPSRAALLTGRRPTTSGIYDFSPEIRKAMPNVITLPQHFKANGYYTQSLGKIFHNPNENDPGWSVPAYWPKEPAYHTPEGVRILQHVTKEKPMASLRDPGTKEVKPRAMAGLPYEAPDVPDRVLNDGIITERALAALRESRERRFFLAVGFLKPHIPFVAPKKYWDLYDRNKLPMPARTQAPEGAPFYSMYDWQDTRRYWGMPHEGRLTDDQTRSMIHGYYACISFIDAQVGRLLDEVERLGLRERTLVILWSDHGYNLGEYGEWDKRNDYETSTRSALMVRVPGQRTRPSRTNALVEFVDIYPSLCELAGIPMAAELEGTSFKPLLENPARPWKQAAFSHITRNVANAGLTIGHAMRTDRYRLVEWRNESGSLREYELYDHPTDPGETKNIAAQPDQAQLLRQLTKQLHAGWRAALPP